MDRTDEDRAARADFLTDEELAEIHCRTEAATPGPWRTDADGCCVYDDTEADVLLAQVGVGGSEGTTADSEFIAHARSDVSRLIAALRVERARADRLEERIWELLEQAEFWATRKAQQP